PAAVGGFVFGRQAGAQVVEALDALGDVSADDAVGAAVVVGKLQGVGELRPGLVHLELPVRPGVGAGIADLQRDGDVGGAGALGERLGGHAGDDLQAEAGGVGGQAGEVRGRLIPFAGVAAAGGGVERDALELVDVGLRVVFLPARRVDRPPH